MLCAIFAVGQCLSVHSSVCRIINSVKHWWGRSVVAEHLKLSIIECYCNCSAVTDRTTWHCLYVCNGVADLLKHAPPHMCYCARFGCSVLKGVGINREEPQRLGVLEFHSLGIGGMTDPKIRAPHPHVCYHVRFSSSVTKGVRANRREPPNWGALGPRPLGGYGWPPKNKPFPHMWDRLSQLSWLLGAL